ncbi:hypothetical protein C8F01DRAFT_1361128 [Mycena amicta]|nr:hypothetical protein C8F01DRAFT_1361128 [Mycena amicta]
MSTSTPNFSRLVDGYKQVDAFLEDEEYEDEEVVYVTLDLGSGVDAALIPSSKSYRLIGLDTPTPFLQLSGTVFRGRHDELLGTEMLFTEGKDTGDWSKRSLAHVGNTERRISFKEVQLKEKVPPPPSTGEAVFVLQGQDVEEPRPDFDLDRITGKTGPIVQRKRREKTKEGDGKKQGKDKQKEKEQEDSVEVAADDDVAVAETTMDQTG